MPDWGGNIPVDTISHGRIIHLKDLDYNKISLSSRSYFDAIVHNNIEDFDIDLFKDCHYKYSYLTIKRIVQTDKSSIFSNIDRYIYNVYYSNIKFRDRDRIMNLIISEMFPMVDGIEDDYNTILETFSKLSRVLDVDNDVRLIKKAVGSKILYKNGMFDYSSIGYGKVIISEKIMSSEFSIRSSSYLQNAMDWDIVIVSHGFIIEDEWKIDPVIYNDKPYDTINKLLDQIAVDYNKPRVLILVCNKDEYTIEDRDDMILNYPKCGLLGEIKLNY